MKFIAFGMVLAVVSGGCKKKDGVVGAGSATGSAVVTVPAAGSATAGSAGAGAATAAVAPAAGDAGKPFEVTFEGKPIHFATVKIDNNYGTDKLVFTTTAGGCDGTYKAGDTMLEVELSAGPGGKRFAPGPIGVDVRLTNETTRFKTSDVNGVLTLEPGEWKVGGKVKGTLRIADAYGDGADKVTYAGSGSFEAQVCGLATTDAYQATPETVDATPVAGTIGDAKVTTVSGIAHLSKAYTGDPKVDMIDLYDTAVDCDTASDAKGYQVIIGGNGGLVGKDVFTGSFQPRTVSYRAPGSGAQNFVAGPAWVKLDTAELKAGGTIKGSLYGETSASKAKEDPKKAVKLAGTFTAKVCE